MPNRDLAILEKVISSVKETIPKKIEIIQNELSGKYKVLSFEHPLDTVVADKLLILKEEIRVTDDDYHIYNSISSIKDLWKLIIEKAIKCLRYFDTREPFLVHSKKCPTVYGINELNNYFNDYSEFESMLYGGGKYYRDHVVHVFRVWLLGISCLLDKNGEYLDKIVIQKEINVNSLEKLSIWSMIALTHDLGYPLEKSQDIIDKTRNMMKSFITNPIVSMDLAFNGVQNNMNDFVIRFMSSKMHEGEFAIKNKKKITAEQPKKFVARLQPKYYFKFQKSLEHCKHGVLSSIIIYKLLIYFLESDFNINEDYRFGEEDVRQFYIRREILRSIAAHTCQDIYHLDMLSFAYLLIIVDDAQEWGRKRLSELYIKSQIKYEFGGLTFHFKEEGKIHECKINEKFTFENITHDGIENILKSLQSQYDRYKEIFRDGQDTANRNFNFTKECNINFSSERYPTYHVEFKISTEKRSIFQIVFSSNDTDRDINEYEDILKKNTAWRHFKKKSRLIENVKKVIFSMDDTY